MSVRRATALKESAGRVEADKQKLLSYVRSGAPVIAARMRGIDVEDPDRGRVVPVAWMTDGAWVWNLGDAYYVEHHGYAFDDDFVMHVVASNYTPPAQVDRRLVQEAGELLTGPR